MSRIYDRRFEILVDNRVIMEARGGRQFRIMFNILQDFGGYNSYADLTLVNMTESTLNRFTRDAKLTIRAGYVNQIDTLFTGYIRNTVPDRDGPTTLFKVIANGSVPVSKRKEINESAGVNTRVTDLLQLIATTLELPLEINATDFASVLPYPRGYQMSGDPFKYLDVLAKAHGFDWIIESERLVIVAKGSSRVGRLHIVTPFEGLEGRPEITEVGADVTVRLNPKIRIGDKFKIESKYRSIQFSNMYFQDVPELAGTGIYNALRVNHVGDSTGDDWSTKVVGIR